MRKKLLTAVCGALLAATIAAGAQVVVRIGPPPPRPVEVIPAAPHPGWVWQEGYHRWDGAHYVWVPGHYVAPPYEHAVWVPGHWANRNGGYVWVEGHWHH
jgi:WXXGXW repeat (2 copies)